MFCAAAVAKQAQGCVDQWIPHVPRPMMCQKALEALGPASSQAPCPLKIDYATEIYKLTREHLLFTHKYLAAPCNLKVYVCVELSQ